jgi:hypothetical protein
MSTTSMEKEPQVDSPQVDSPPENEEESYLTGLTLLSVLVSLVLVIFLMMLDTSIVATAIPRITTQFHSLDDVGWYAFDPSLAHLSGDSLLTMLSTVGMEVHTCWPTVLYNLSPVKSTKSSATSGLSSGSLLSSNSVPCYVASLPLRTCSSLEEPLLVWDARAC